MAYADQPTSDLGTTLKRARKAAKFTNAKDFLAAVKDAEGSAPSYSTYAQWESGEVRPRDESLTPIEAFHRERGTWVEAAVVPDLATALLALARSNEALALELAETRRERLELRAQVDEMAATLALLVERSPDAQGTGAPRVHAARDGSTE